MGDMGGVLTPQMLAVAVGFVTLGVFLLVGFAISGPNQSKERAKRITRLKQPPEARKVEAKKISLKRSSADSSIQAFDVLIKRFLPNPQKLRARLSKTGRKISLGQYLITCFILGVVAAAGIALYFQLPVAAAVPLGLTLGILLPHFVIGRMVGRRQARFNALFPEAIDLIVRGLKSGLPVTESVKTVGTEISNPVGEEFRQVSDLMKFGTALDEALWAVAPHIDTPEFRFFIITLSIQSETGGNLAETLENLGNVLRRRKQMKLKIKAFSSEAKASAMIIGSLPFVMFGIILSVNYNYEIQLFQDTRGLMMIGAGLTSFATGLMVMAKMIRFEI